MTSRRSSNPHNQPSSPTNGAPTDAAPSRTTVWAIALALVVLTVATYAPVRGFDYVQLDDPAYVTENAQVRAGLTVEGIRWAFSTGTSANWHPLAWLSHMLDVSLFGVAPGPHHLVNVALHTTSAVLLFLVLTFWTSSPWRSGFVAAVFALHPLHVESVAWVAERKDVLSAFFWMLTLAAYAGYAARPTRTRMLLVSASFALGLMAKPMLVTLPFVLLLLDLWPLRRWSASSPAGLVPLVREKLPLFVLSAASSVITLVVQDRGGAMAGLQTVPFGLRLENAVVSPVMYLFKMIWPVDLTVLYSLPDQMPMVTVAGAALLLVAITVLAYRSVGERPFLLVGWLWYLGTLVPVSGVVQVGLQSMADRYTYIPLIGISIMVAWAPSPSMMRSAAVRMGTAAFGAAAVVAMAAMTRSQLPMWQNNVTLFTAATMRTTGVDEHAAHLSLGATLLQEQRFDEARVHYREALRLQPDSAVAAHGLGLSFLNAGRAMEAITPLERAVLLAPDDTGPRNDLAVSYVRTNRLDDAIREYRKLTQLKPDKPRFAQALSVLLSRKK